MPIDRAAAGPAVGPGAGALAALGTAWHALEAASGNGAVFLTPEWQDAWWRHFGAGRPLRPALLPDRAAPLVLALFFDDGGTLRLVGAPEGEVDLADYLDALAVAGREEEAWGTLAGWLAADRGFSRAVLDNVPDGSPTLVHAPAALERAGLRMTVEPQARCPVVPLPGDFDAYLAGLDRDARHEVRRKVRRLEREAPGASVRLLRAADAMAALPDFIRLHRLSGADKARFMSPGMERFFADMAAGLAARDRLVVARLDAADGAPMAAMCLLEYRGGWYLYNSGYDPAFARVAPGFVLLVRCVEAACAAGVRLLDFLRGTERYKYDLGGRDRIVYRVTIERGGPA